MLLDRKGSVPLYEQIKNIIEQQIKNGELKEGEKIPSERELCEIYDVSRITVRQAIALAENEGLLYRSQGMGTFVAKPKIKQELTRVNTFETSLAQHGFVASTETFKSRSDTQQIFIWPNCWTYRFRRKSSTCN